MGLDHKTTHIPRKEDTNPVVKHKQHANKSKDKNKIKLSQWRILSINAELAVTAQSHHTNQAANLYS